MKPPKDSLLLIDGHAILFRAFHALPPLKTKEGLLTNAVYGFITTLLKAIEELKPKYVAVSFDVAGKTFRHHAYEGYKASRQATPEDLSSQIPLAYELVEALNLPIYTKEGYEADDVIGTLSKQAKEHNVPVIIVTGDRDSFQLVDNETFVYLIRRNVADTLLIDANGVKESLGVMPEQVTHYKALAGDSSDEIPGIDGVGPKTAVTILETARNIPGLYNLIKEGKKIPGITDRIYQKLVDGEKIAQQSLELATIDRDVPIKLDLQHSVLDGYNQEKLTALLQKLEFYSLIKRIGLSGLAADQAAVSEPHESAPPKRDWKFTTLTNPADIQKVVDELKETRYLAIDTETDGINGPIIGISFSPNDKEGYYIPVVKSHGAQRGALEIGKLIKPLLENEFIGKLGHNVKYDLRALYQLGIYPSPIVFDTMVAAYILHAHLRSFDLDTVAQRELSYTKIAFASLAGKGAKATLLNAEVEKVAEYAVEDVVITYRLFEHFDKELKKNDKLNEVAQKIDFPLIEVLAAMEQRGVCINTKKLKELEEDLEKEITDLRQKIQGYAKDEININSPAQLQKLLFEELKLDRTGIRSTSSGGFSTAAGELEKLQGLHPIVDLILRYRELTKLQSTYVKTLPQLVDQTGRVHTEFSQTTAATGRLASNNPNLQNIPIRTETGNKIREAFTAPRGYTFISLDYSQIELRLIAHLSGDKKLKQAFTDGRDIHDEVAKAMNVDRRAAKAINFGILYGLSAFGLSQGLKIPQPQAKQYIDKYFATYPQLKNYLDDTKKEVKDKGYVETLFGRKREIPEIHAANAIVRAAAERMAINMPAQGTEADIIKLAMIEVQNWLIKEYDHQEDRPYLLLQVHDSLLLEVPNDLVDSTAKKVKEIMESVCKVSVPLNVDISIGHNWGQLEKLK